ncbi:MAG: transposase [Thiomicrorhabdus sp.]|nr:transposase [Thiomicrorhabdus sp.]
MYDPELKERAIEMALLGKKPVAQVARDLDINANTLYTWVDKFKLANSSAFPKPENVQPVNLEVENRRLQKSLAEAKKDIELLKKVAVYFAAHSK